MPILPKSLTSAKRLWLLFIIAVTGILLICIEQTVRGKCAVQCRELVVQINACKMAVGHRSFMSSLQCLETTEGLITNELCLPPESEILRFDSGSFLSYHSKSKQTVCVATQYASAPCKLTISSHLFARWRCCSGITISSYLFARWHLLWHVGCLSNKLTF